MKSLLTALALLAALTGCAPPPSDRVVFTAPERGGYKAEPEDLDRALAEQLRAGSVQAAAATATLEEALKAARVLAAESSDQLREAAQTVVDLVDSAGATLADVALAAPDEAAVKADFAKADDDRKKRIADANDAYRDLGEALGTADSLGEDDPGFLELAGLLQLAADDTRDVVLALGGQPDEPNAEEAPPEPTQTPAVDDNE